MSDFTLVIGNKCYSSWSLRGWLALKLCDQPFDEIVIPLRQPDTRARIMEHSPAGKVPTLKTDGLVIWDSLAIGEYLAERFPEAGLWPAAPESRAVARSIVAEMHSGFPALRQHLPMDLRASRPGEGHAPEAMADAERIMAIWRDCRYRFGAGDAFLFGAAGLADAFYAPVVSRFRTYGLKLDGVCQAYSDAVLDWAPMRDWIAAAQAEPWTITFEQL